MKRAKDFYSNVEQLSSDIDSAGYSASGKQLDILIRIEDMLSVHGLEMYMSDFDFKIISELKQPEY